MGAPVCNRWVKATALGAWRAAQVSKAMRRAKGVMTGGHPPLQCLSVWVVGSGHGAGHAGDAE